MICQYSINKFAYDGGDKPGQGGTVTLYVMENVDWKNRKF